MICSVTGSRQYSSDLPQDRFRNFMCVNIQLCCQRWQPFREGQKVNRACPFLFTLNEVSELEDSLSKVKIEASESMG